MFSVSEQKMRLFLVLIFIETQILLTYTSEPCTEVSCSTRSPNQNVTGERILPETTIPCHFHTNHTDTCLHLVEGNRTWTEASQTCQTLGGELVMAKEAWQVDFMLELLETLELESLWVGAQEKTGNWTWEDGSLLDYVNWKDREPDNRAGKEHCVIAVPYRDYVWADKPCSADYEFLCHLPLTPEKCAQNETNVFVKTGCLAALRQRTGWQNARQICHSMGGTLAVVNDSMVTMALGRIPHIVNAWYSNGLWVGLTRSRWYWNDGEEVSLSYTPRPEPIQSSSIDTQCLGVQTNLKGDDHWVRRSCEDRLATICILSTSDVLITSTSPSTTVTMETSTVPMTNQTEKLGLATPSTNQQKDSSILSRKQVAGISSGVLVVIAVIVAIVIGALHIMRKKAARSSLPLLREDVISAFQSTTDENAHKSGFLRQGGKTQGQMDKDAPVQETSTEKVTTNEVGPARKSLFHLVKNCQWPLKKKDHPSASTSAGSCENCDDSGSSCENSDDFNTSPDGSAGFRHCYFREAPPSMVIGEGPSASHQIEALMGVSVSQAEGLITELP